ncbi:MAG: peptidylprolyl isomerase [Xanthomonadales bacterium]|jgi:parvulin-like peptidyl-prolyl isomerase|nr:peptidylprolyl isomerase [Xanthomonadales bacterium]
MRNRLIAVAALFACAVTAVAQEAQPAGAQSNYLIAKQGKAEVWAIDVDAHLAAMPAGDRAGFIDSPKRIQQLLGHLLLRRNLALEARESGLDKGPVVERELEQAVEVVLMRYRLEQLRKNIQVPDLEQLAKEKFLASRDAFKSSETVSIAHVLLDTKERTDQQAHDQLLAWKAEVASGKTTIEELAKVHSDDPGVPTNKGLYENTDVNSFVPEFAEAVRKLGKPGDLSEPVKTQFGYHLIQLRARTPGKAYTWDDVKDRLIAAESDAFIKKELADYVERIKNLPIEASEASVLPLRERYGKITAAPVAEKEAPAVEAVAVPSDGAK